MLEFDYTKEYRLPMDISLRMMRIRKHPIKFDENMVIEDQLEATGTIKVYEKNGGNLHMPMDTDTHDVECNTDVVQIAELKVSIFHDEKRVHLDKLYCEYGYSDELAPLLLEQAVNFADFYNYEFRFLDLRKKRKQPAFSKGRAIADMMI